MRIVIVIGICAACAGPTTRPDAPKNERPSEAPFTVVLGEATTMMGDRLIATLRADGTLEFGDRPVESFLVKLDGTVWMTAHYGTKAAAESEYIGVARLTADGALLAASHEKGVPARFVEPLPIKFTGDNVTISAEGTTSSSSLTADGTLAVTPAPADLPAPVRLVTTDPKVRRTLFRLISVVPLASHYLATKRLSKPSP